VANKIVYVSSLDNHLYALSANSGHRIVRMATGGAITDSPTVSDGVVYVGSYDFKVFAFAVYGTIPA
jgi:outer membrane protein assembly factor BamB